MGEPVAIPAVAVDQDRSWRDGIDAHAMGHKFQRPALGIEDQRRLGGAVLGFVRDTCNEVSQQESSRKVHLLGQLMSTTCGL
jgi:hypothetical protein